MIITLVVDQFFQNTNGTSVSAQNLCRELEEKGHTVRVLTVDNGDKTQYALKERNFGAPINKIIHSQGMQLAKPNKDIIEHAIIGSDVVHVYTPFKLGQKVISLCKKHNIPCTAAFHILPENITSTIYMKKFKLVNATIWLSWYIKIYKNIKHIHCPSLMVANQIKRHGYRSKLHIISNGYKNNYVPMSEPKPTILKNKIIIVATGRFSREKRYDLLFKAIKKSKHKKDIVLILGGKGPQLRKYKKFARKLPNMPIFLGKYNQEQQLSFLNFADLYIHPADIEVEGMTCLEACACGCVPIVSDSKKSATRQFVTNEQSIFKHGNAKDLAKKIDWWLDNPQQLEEQKELVAEHATNFSLRKSVDLYLDMFNAAINDCKKTEEKI